MVPQTSAHRALADAETTAGVLDRLLAPVGGWSMMLCDALVQQGGPIAFKPAAATGMTIKTVGGAAADVTADQSMVYLSIDGNANVTTMRVG